jgi:hypothetical protein
MAAKRKSSGKGDAAKASPNPKSKDSKAPPVSLQQRTRSGARGGRGRR